MAFWDPNSLSYVIDWSAWATLVVGIAAVVGAFLVGQKQAQISLRQTEIASRQAEIMEKQTAIASLQAEIEQTRLRAELYDRRVLIYSGIETFLNAALSNDGDVTGDDRDGIFSAMTVARYLLGVDVEKIAKEIYRAAILLRGDVGRLDRLRDGQDEVRESLFAKIEGHNDKLGALGLALEGTKETYLRLADVRGSELQ